jgi:IS4 transposase
VIIDALFQRFIEKAPLPVMVRALLERTFHPERLDAWFDQTADAQDTRALLFSTLFELMSQVVCGVCRSIHDAYQAAEHIATSVGAVYRKLARLEPTTVTELVRYSAQESQAVMDALEYTRPSPIPGYVVKILDGNALAATEHRLKELRPLQAAALPGKAVVVYEPARNLMVDLVPCADGHAQERSLLPALVETVQRGEVWVGDRNFCVTDFLVGIAERGAYFIVREHEQVRCTPQEAMRDRGRVETGTVAEQRVVLTRAGQATLAVRRIAVRLDQPTRAGDTTLYILTNLPPEAAPATVVARVYRGRWRLETAFQILATALTSEINTLAYPKAALFGFAVAVVTYNVLATAKAALAKVHGADPIEREFSDYYLAAELDAVAAGMAVALPAQDWHVFRTLPLTEFVAFLLTLAQNVRLARFRKHPRGPKKPQPKRSYDPKHPHVSTARLIAARK